MGKAIFPCPYCKKMFSAELIFEELVNCPHCNGVILPTSENDDAVNCPIGDYVINSIVGRADLGTVFKAQHSLKHHQVYLKILPNVLAYDQNTLRTFKQQASKAWVDQHPGIICMVQYNVVDDIHFLVSAPITGDSLSDALDRHRVLPEKKILQYGIKIAELLNYAWRNDSYIHSNICPGNIIVDINDNVKLLDSRIIQHINGQTLKGVEDPEVFPYYMSPEQTKVENSGWSTDLYSLGATMHHLMTGLLPFDSPDIMQVFAMHTHLYLPDPATRNPNVPLNFATAELISKMMGKLPSDRYISWQNFLTEASAALFACDDPNANNHNTRIDQVPKAKTSRSHKRKKATSKIGGSKKQSTVVANIPVAVKGKKPGSHIAESPLERTRTLNVNSTRSHRNSVYKAKAKQKTDNVTVVIVVLMILAFLGGSTAYFIIHSEKNNNLAGAFRKAEETVQLMDTKNPVSYEETIKTLQSLKAQTKDSPYYSKIEKMITQITADRDSLLADFNAFDTSYEKLMATYDEAKVKLKQSETDENLYEGVVVAYETVLKSANQIPKSSDKFRNERIKVLSAELAKVISDYKKKIAKREQIKADAIRLEEEKTEKEQLAKEQHEKKIKKLKKRVAEDSRKVKVRFLVYCRRHSYDQVKEDDIFNEQYDDITEEELSQDIATFKELRNRLMRMLTTASSVWQLVYDSGENYSRYKIKYKDGSYEIDKIENSMIFYKKLRSFSKETKTDKIENLTDLQQVLLFNHALTENGEDNPKPKLAVYFLATGNFKIGKQLATASEKKFFSELITEFIIANLVRFNERMDIPAEVSRAQTEYNHLKELYGQLPEYNDAYQKAKDQVGGSFRFE